MATLEIPIGSEVRLRLANGEEASGVVFANEQGLMVLKERGAHSGKAAARAGCAIQAAQR
jgi:hypothetical protein